MFEDGSDDSDDEEARAKADKDQKGKVFVRKGMDYMDEENYYKAKAGEVLNKDFKILGSLGQGVYGSVVSALQMSTGKKVAIKVKNQNFSIFLFFRFLSF